MVPGLAVSRYLEPTVRRIEETGVRCDLVRLPTSGPPVGIPEYAALVAECVGDREVVLVGHSSGTQVAAAVAGKVAVARLVPGGPTVDPACRTVPRVMARWLIDGAREPASLAWQEFPEWGRAGPRRIFTLLRSMLRHPLEDLLAEVTAPLTVVRGGRDPLCTTGWSSELGGELVTLPGLPHAFPYLDPVAFARIVVEHCSG